MKIDLEPMRAFCVTPDGIITILIGSEARIRAMGVSPAVSAAVDILLDNGDATDDLVKLCFVAEREGKDPEAFARHLVKLRKVVKEEIAR